MAESKNFNEAAAKLQISQPAVSFKLRELESQLPLPVFQLEGKRKVLTHYGRALYEVALKQAKGIEKSIEDLHRLYAQPESLTLRIGGRAEVLESIAPTLDFAGKIELVDLNSQEAVEKLQTHEIDIAISYKKPDSAEIIAKKIFQSSSCFVVHEKFLKKKKLGLELARDTKFLTETPCILYLRDGHVLADWMKHVKIPFESLQVRFVAEDWRTVQNLVDQGMGYALVPEYIKSFSKDVHRLELPTQVMPSYVFYALYEKGLKKIEPFKKVLEFSGFMDILSKR